MPASIIAADPYEEMARVVFGRVRRVSPETGIVAVELRPESGASKPILANCRLPEDGTAPPQQGDVIEILVSRGSKIVRENANQAQPTLFGSLDRAKALTGFRRMFEHVGSTREFEATLLRREGKTGWIVKLEGWDGFAANDPPGTDRGKRPKVGEKTLVQVLQFVRERGNFLLQWSEHLRRQAVRVAVDNLAVGEVVSGRVSDIVNFGAFVEVKRSQGAFTALLPNAESSWRPNTKVVDVVQKGSTHEFRVQKIAETSKGQIRIILSLKALLPSPWDQFGQDLSAGDELLGTVRNVTDFGIFVEVLPALEALLHRTRMDPPCEVGEPHKRYSPGDQIHCRVIQIDIEARRLGVEELRKGAARSQ